MDPASLTASIITISDLALSVSGYLNTVRHASTEKQNIAIQIPMLYRLLITLRFRVEGAASDAPWFLQVKILGEENGLLDQFESTLEAIKAKCQLATGVSKVKKALTWKFDKAHVEEALKKMERLEAFINFALQDDLSSLSKAIHNQVGSIALNVSNVADGVSQLQLHKANENQQNICQWLDPPDPSSNHNAACGKKQSSTGSWFLGSEKFISWKTNPGSLLWAYGIPGCGKTVLSSTIIEHLLQHCHKELKSSIAYFYFDFSNAALQSHEKLVRSLVIQLSRQSSESFKKLEQLYEDRGHWGQPTYGALVDVLSQQLAGPDPIYIILDALDECQLRGELMGSIRTIANWHKASLHLLLTSRKETDIEDVLEPLLSENVCLTRKEVDADIQIYISEQLQQDPKLKKWPAHIKSNIETSLMQGAHGMFRWAFCQLESIKKCISPAGLRRTLGSLPKTLNETYERILIQIPEEHHSETHRILQWLCYSARPLRVVEMVEVVAIGESGFDPEERPFDPANVVTICSSLVSIVQSTSRDPEVHLAHFSVKEYLLSDQIPAMMLSKFDLRAGPAHANIARDCLLYTLHLCSSLITKRVLYDHPLAEYAAEQWIFHMTINESVLASREPNMLALELLTSPKKLSAWLLLFDPDGFQSIFDLDREGPSAPPLYYASLLGMIEVSKMLLETGVDVNAQGGYYGNALQAASVGGDRKVVELLLDRGADVNAHRAVGIYQNALQAASGAGHRKVVELLLDRGADLDGHQRRGQYSSALRFASSRGHINVVEFLLGRFADINTQERGILHSKPLQAASRNCHPKIVALLLRNGGIVSEEAVKDTSRHGNKEDVELLLLNGGTVSGKAVETASMYNDKEVVELLLLNGGIVSEKAVEEASAYNDKEVVELLLLNGGIVSEKAVEEASAHNEKEVVELLLLNGGIVSEKAVEEGSRHGKKEIIELLLLNGGTVSEKAVENACSRYPDDTIEFILQYDDTASEEAIKATAVYYKKEIIELLLLNGGTVSEQAVENASWYGRKEIIEPLLLNGGIVSEKAVEEALAGGYEERDQRLSSGNRITTEVIEGERCFKETLELLLSNGGIVTEKAVKMASSRDDEEVAELLRRHQKKDHSVDEDRQFDHTTPERRHPRGPPLQEVKAEGVGEPVADALEGSS